MPSEGGGQDMTVIEPDRKSISFLFFLRHVHCAVLTLTVLFLSVTPPPRSLSLFWMHRTSDRLGVLLWNLLLTTDSNLLHAQPCTITQIKLAHLDIYYLRLRVLVSLDFPLPCPVSQMELEHPGNSLLTPDSHSSLDFSQLCTVSLMELAQPGHFLLKSDSYLPLNLSQLCAVLHVELQHPGHFLLTPDRNLLRCFSQPCALTHCERGFRASDWSVCHCRSRTSNRKVSW